MTADRLFELAKRMRLRSPYSGADKRTICQRAAVLVLQAEGMLGEYFAAPAGKPMSISAQWRRDAPYCEAIHSLLLLMEELRLVHDINQQTRERIRTNWCDAYDFHTSWLADLLDPDLKIECQRQVQTGLDYKGRPQFANLKMYTLPEKQSMRAMLGSKFVTVMDIICGGTSPQFSSRFRSFFTKPPRAK